MNSISKRLLLILFILAIPRNCCGVTPANIAEGTIVIAGIVAAAIGTYEDHKTNSSLPSVITYYAGLFAFGTALLATLDRYLFSDKWNWWHSYLRASAMATVYGMWVVVHRNTC